jgi:gluconokinase
MFKKEVFDSMSMVEFQQAEAPLIVSIDIGTSSIRAALFDSLGRAVKDLEARRPHEVRTDAQGASEADPDFLLDLIFQCLDQVMARVLPSHLPIGGVGVCSFVNNILGLDRNRRVVIPLTTYADTRAAAEVAGLKTDFDEEVTHERTGCHFHPSYLPARFRWLARSQPEKFRNVDRFVSIGEYLESKLFGDTAVSYSVASWTGLLNRNALEWDRDLLAGLPIRIDQLSPLTDVQVPRRGLRPEFASRWPALAEIPWFPAVGDGATANVGSGCVSPKRVALTVGTTSAMRVVLAGQVKQIPHGLWCYRVDGRRSLLGGALSEGGSVFAWMRSTLRFESEGLDDKLMALEPDGHGLTFLPFFAGERAPGWAGHARATMHGLSLATTPLDILHAALEGVAYRIALVFELLRPLMPGDPQVVASGGAILSSPAWLKIMANAIGRPVAASGVPEASARGSALLALEALGIIPDLEEAPDFIRATYEPIPSVHRRYRDAIERQKELYQKLVRI